MEQKKQKLMIFLAGELRRTDKLQDRIRSENFDFYAADGGYRYASDLELPLKKVLGDFDSMDMPTFPDLLKFPSEKDETDSELALHLAVDDGYRDIWMIAPFGGRIDHTIANIHLLEEARKEQVTLTLYDGENLVFLAEKGTHLFSNDYKYVSFIPWGNVATVSLNDFKYPLDRYTLIRGKSIGTSNEPLGKAPTLQVHAGAVLCICIENNQEEL